MREAIIEILGQQPEGHVDYDHYVDDCADCKAFQADKIIALITSQSEDRAVDVSMLCPEPGCVVPRNHGCTHQIVRGWRRILETFGAEPPVQAQPQGGTSGNETVGLGRHVIEAQPQDDHPNKELWDEAFQQYGVGDTVRQAYQRSAFVHGVLWGRNKQAKGPATIDRGMAFAIRQMIESIFTPSRTYSIDDIVRNLAVVGITVTEE